MTPSILGNSFSENEPLDFIHHGMAWGTVLRLSFPTSWGDAATLGHCRAELMSAPPGRVAGGGCSDVAVGNEIQPHRELTSRVLEAWGRFGFLFVF